jgi:hypothetical protein
VVYLIQHYMIKLASDLRHVGGFHRVLRFPPPIKLTGTIKLKYCWKWRETPPHPLPIQLFPVKILLEFASIFVRLFVFHLCLAVFHLCLFIFHLCLFVFHLCLFVFHLCLFVFHLCLFVFHLCLFVCHLCLFVYHLFLFVFHLCLFYLSPLFVFQFQFVLVFIISITMFPVTLQHHLMSVFRLHTVKLNVLS